MHALREHVGAENADSALRDYHEKLYGTAPRSHCGRTAASARGLVRDVTRWGMKAEQSRAEPASDG